MRAGIGVPPGDSGTASRRPRVGKTVERLSLVTLPLQHGESIIEPPRGIDACRGEAVSACVPARRSFGRRPVAVAGV